ncbi:hypothetical protein Naga_101643g2 [Nannochloropsis gaditana]|uniref:Transmembrane protein n=1 Tax=Nannochloropsis gaditana TaxID=72520 RepID=W7TVX5_9STRA|nr:hypothetical protein Naga_101643g2 [Nannochloropsis gaditana]
MRRLRPFFAFPCCSLLFLPLLSFFLPAAAEEAPLCGTSPAFLWGGRENYFGGREEYAFSSVGHDEVVESVRSLQRLDTPPEVVVVLVTSASPDVPSPSSLPSLKAAVQEAVSSRVIPCLTR